jgi:MFS family permease
VGSAVRSRVAVAYSFAVLGVVLGSVASRNADLKARVGADKAQWTLILFAAPIGSLVGLLLVRRFIGRVGVRRYLLVVAPCVATMPAIFALARTPWELALGFAVNGMAAGSLQAPVNASAVFVERAYGRPIMASFHAWFSIGLLAGAGVSSYCANTLALHTQLAFTAAVLVAGFAALASWLPRDGVVEQGKRRPLRSISPQLVLLGSIAMCSSIGEGATTQWASIYVHQSLHATARVAAVAYFVYASCAATNRLLADRVLHRLGRRRFLRTAGLVAASGLAVGLVLGNVPGAFVAFVFMGIGFSAIVPTVFGAAGNEPGYSASEGLATVALIYWPAFLLGPALIGSLAQATSIRTALFIPVGTATLLAFLARWVRERGPEVEGPVPVES